MLRGRWFWPILSGLFLLGAYACASQAPCGAWRNQVLGVPFWDSCDPGGAYFGSAAHLFGPSRIPAFVGHPGLTLHWLLWAVIQISYRVHLLSGGSGEFPDFAARNIYQLYTACAVAIAGVHILSFVVLERLALRLFSDLTTARLAVLGYATSFPVLYYLVRISVEPFVVLFFLSTVLAVWQGQDALQRNERRAAIGYSVLAALACAAGFVSKVHLLGPLPLFIFAQLLLGGSLNTIDRSGMRQRATLAAWFAGSFILFFVVSGLQVDWFAFYHFWSATVREDSVIGAHPAVSHSEILSQALVVLACEGLFVVVSLYGLRWYWQEHAEQRSRVCWLFGYAAVLLPLTFMRAQFHYFFIPIVVGAIFFGPGVRRLGTRMVERPAGRALAATLLLHALAGWSFFDAKRHDTEIFRREFQPYEQALAQTLPSELIGVLLVPGQPAPDLFLIHGMYPSFIPDNFPVPQAFRNLFVVVYAPSEAVLSKEEQEQFRQHKIGTIIDQRRIPAEAMRFDAWARRMNKINTP